MLNCFSTVSFIYHMRRMKSNCKTKSEKHTKCISNNHECVQKNMVNVKCASRGRSAPATLYYSHIYHSSSRTRIWKNCVWKKNEQKDMSKWNQNFQLLRIEFMEAQKEMMAPFKRVKNKCANTAIYFVFIYISSFFEKWKNSKTVVLLK